MTLIFAFISTSFAQEQDPEQARQYVEVAEGMIEGSMAYDDVREIMVRAADLDTTFLRANFEAGELHMRTIGKDLAVKYFLRVFRQDPNYRFDIQYWIGRSYQMGLNFDKAIEYYNMYKERLAGKPNYQGRDKVDLAVVERSIYECQNGMEFVANPGNYSIVNIGREINSEYEDYAPVLNGDETELIFTSRRREDNLNENVFEDNKPYEDIFISKRVGDTWERARNIGPVVNTPYHNSNLALSKDGNTLFIYNDDNGGDIYYSERDPSGEWGKPVPLPGIINSSFNEKSISISSDERTLYFASDRPGGFGGIDIYRATLDSKGQWTNVRNLGPKINTEFDEEGPFIDQDNMTLYFSSKGHKGMGGHDIFKSVFDPETNEWSDPENLGYPINTPDDDVYFVASADGTRAYYSSVREDGMGYTDIYMIVIPEGLKDTPPILASADTTQNETVEKDPEPVVTEPVVTEKEPDTTPDKPAATAPVHYVVSVVDAETQSPLNARVRLQGLRDNIIVASARAGNGVTDFTVAGPQEKEYRLSVELDGYVFVNETIRLPGAGPEPQTINRTISLRKLAVGVSGVLRNIYFDFDKWSFKNESYNELNKLERMMQQNPNIQVEISGHTDNIGAKAYNMFLSRKRAEAVKDFLTGKGIDARRIKATGYGEDRPLASNDDEREGRELNRRVEFLVIGE
ncbi:MAG TPA: OmpA family protein [Cyclobacteriaceae bacterium]|nr:OmpA family protein [Cyclobacteriaceae bacterium]